MTPQDALIERVKKVLHEVSSTLFPEVRLDLIDISIADRMARRAKTIRGEDGRYSLTVARRVAEGPYRDLFCVLAHEMAHIVSGVLPPGVSATTAMGMPLTVLDEATADLLALKRIALAYAQGKLSDELLKTAAIHFVKESELISLLTIFSDAVGAMEELGYDASSAVGEICPFLMRKWSSLEDAEGDPWGNLCALLALLRIAVRGGEGISDRVLKGLLL